MLAEALALMHCTGEGFHGAELHRLQGESLLRQEAAAVACHEAEACFRRAFTLARKQQAKSLELRAAMSLTRLYQIQNRQAEARPMLAECYHWMSGKSRFCLAPVVTERSWSVWLGGVLPCSAAASDRFGNLVASDEPTSPARRTRRSFRPPMRLGRPNAARPRNTRYSTEPS